MSDSLVALYRTAMGQADPIYSGTEYLGYVRRPKGHPFFESDRLLPAKISLGGVYYHDSILYDLVDDALILKNYDGSYDLKLVNEKIQSFSLMDHFFVRLGGNADSADLLEPGFYERIYNGKLAVFVRHKKQINTTSIQSEMQSEYVQYDTYFIRKGGEYLRVHNRNSLLQALKERKNEVRSFLRKQNLDFKKDPFNSTRKAAEFFDQVNK